MAKRPMFQEAGPLKAKDKPNEADAPASRPTAAKRATTRKANESHKFITAEVTPETHTALKALCAANGETMTTVIVRFINQYFEENGKPAIAAAAKR